MLSTPFSRRKASPAPRRFRPTLECLEDRSAPAALLPTTLAINPIGASVFGPTTQKETVSVQATVSTTGAPVTSGLVTITDGGQVQTVPVNSQGLATATFTFGLLQGQEVPGPHTVQATYADPNSVFGSSSAANAQAPDNTRGFHSQIFFDLAFLFALGL